MTKQEIHNLIYASTLTQLVLEEKMIGSFNVCNTYEYTILLGDTETANINKIGFYVINEGEANEKAYWRPGMKNLLYPITENPPV